MCSVTQSCPLFGTLCTVTHQAPLFMGFPRQEYWSGLPFLPSEDSPNPGMNFCFIDHAKAFDCVDHNKLENSERDGHTRPPDLPPEKPVCRSGRNRIGHGTIDWFQIGKGVCQGCILSPCLFNLYADYIMRNAGLDEAQAGIKIAGRNINNLKYADDTCLWQKVKRN